MKIGVWTVIFIVAFGIMFYFSVVSIQQCMNENHFILYCLTTKGN